MLHAHSEIEFTTETHFVKRYIRLEVEKNLYGWDKVENLKEELLNDGLLRDIKKNITEIINKSVLEKPNQFLTGSVFYNLLDANNVTYIGDKDPMNVNYLSIIKKSFPEAYIIHIIRDPRDVVLSRMKSKWGNRNSIFWHTSEYKFSIKKGRKEGISLFKNNYLEVRYEQLISSTENELKRICEFLNLSFEAGMMNHQLQAKSLLRNDEMDWKSNVLDPVDPGKIGKWKENISRKQLIVIEAILSNDFEKLGYKKSLDSSFINRFYYTLIGKIFGSFFKLKFG